MKPLATTHRNPWRQASLPAVEGSIPAARTKRWLREWLTEKSKHVPSFAVPSTGLGSPALTQAGCLTLRGCARLLLLGALGAFTVAGSAAAAELKLVPQTEPERVFSGKERTFNVTWQNTGNESVTAELQMRLLQTSSSTTALIGEWPWKKLQVLPGQTVLERATLDFPDVKAETRFLVHWMEGTNHLFGTTEILVYPTNLLAQLKPLAGEDQPVGVFDPDNILKPLLKAASIDCEDMQDSGIADFRGKLAIIGPFSSRDQSPGDLKERIEKLARKGTGVVWLQPPPAPRAKLQPSFRSVTFGTNAVVVVQPQLIARLADDPQAQLNLIRFCQLACEPEPTTLPDANRETP